MKVGIIGGGAAGLMAAISSLKCGNETYIIEKNDILGKKLLITGKGRCNVTNNTDINGLMNNIPVNAKFLYSAFNEFSAQDTMEFFESEGVSLKTERGKRVFPVSDKASDIVSALSKKIKELGGKIINDEAECVLADENGANAVKCKENGIIQFDKIIVATGGMSYKNTGSTGDGYKFAKMLGVEVSEIKPSLVPLVIKESFCKNLQGLSLKNVTLSVYDTKLNKKIYSELGEMLFTHFGISGPLVLSASSYMRNMEDGRYKAVIDLKPALDEAKLDARVLREFTDASNKNLFNVMKSLLPGKMTGTLLSLCQLDGREKINSITKEQRKKLYIF